MAGAFDGLCVLELTWGIAGPMTGMMLADQGANVTRIEPPHDPFARQPGSRVWNRGKRSAVLDLCDPAARQAFLALADRADIEVRPSRHYAVRGQEKECHPRS